MRWFIKDVNWNVDFLSIDTKEMKKVFHYNKKIWYPTVKTNKAV